MTTPNSLLSPRHAIYVQHRIAGKNATDAARLAGYSEGTIRNAYKIDNVPAIKAELDRMRAEVAKQSFYDAATAMRELEEAMDFARSEEGANASALAKCIELKMKLTGLLIERIDQRQVGNFSVNISGINSPQTAIEGKVLPDDDFEDLEEPKEKEPEATEEALAALIEEALAALIEGAATA